MDTLKPIRDRKPGKGYGRKPVNLDGVKQAGQDAIWKAIRKLRKFDYQEIAIWLSCNSYSGISDYTIESYVRRLKAAGYVKITVKSLYRGKVYRGQYELIKDVGAIAPRLTKEGQRSIQGKGRENLWRSMKILGVFNVRELASTASNDEITVRYETAHEYARRLSKAGYLVVVKKAKKSGGLTRYRFLKSKDTGPFPPKIQRNKAIFDANLQQVVWEPKPKTEEVAES